LGRFTGFSRGRSSGNCGCESNGFVYSHEPDGAILLRSCTPPAGIAIVSAAVREIPPTKAAQPALWMSQLRKLSRLVSQFLDFCYLELLDLVRSEHFAFTRFGQYLQQLRQRFSGPVVIDMFCLLRLELELSVEAKAMLLARESELEVPITSDLHDSIREIEYLRASIERTGLLALKPLQVTSGRDLWHRYLLASGAN
jgi:hypothetical protein